ncbi:MAG: hypothetical protein OXL96_21350 [Candidatus Poribacteria bacterium]|nr:hypothetical protein [Candidatus Poribacteria bacterium]
MRLQPGESCIYDGGGAGTLTFFIRRDSTACLQSTKPVVDVNRDFGIVIVRNIYIICEDRSITDNLFGTRFSAIRNPYDGSWTIRNVR